MCVHSRDDGNGRLPPRVLDEMGSQVWFAFTSTITIFLLSWLEPCSSSAPTARCLCRDTDGEQHFDVHCSWLPSPSGSASAAPLHQHHSIIGVTVAITVTTATHDCRVMVLIPQSPYHFCHHHHHGHPHHRNFANLVSLMMATIFFSILSLVLHLHPQQRCHHLKHRPVPHGP